MFHAFTGCDTVSHFAQCGEKTAWKVGCNITRLDVRRHSRKPRSVRLGHHIITMQQSEDNGTERAVLMENSFKDEFEAKFCKDRGDRRPSHADQPQTLSDAQCSQEITDIKHGSMCCL